MLTTRHVIQIIQHTPDYKILHTLLIFFSNFMHIFKKKKKNHRFYNEDLIQEMTN